MFGLLRSPMLDVDRVQVLGGQTTGMDALQRALGIGIGDQMVDLDLGAAERRLEQLPWVRTARVVRSWPATLRVIVVERHPEARIADPDGRWWLADGTGRLLDVVSDPPPDLLQVDGYVVGGQRGAQLSERATAGLALAARLPLDVARRTASLRFPDPDGIDLVVDPQDAPGAQRPDPPPSGPVLPAPYAVVHLGSIERGRREAAGRLDRARPGRPHLPGRDRRARARQAGRHPPQRLRLTGAVDRSPAAAPSPSTAGSHSTSRAGANVARQRDRSPPAR